MARRKQVLTEAIQFVPILVLASRFIVSGEIDLSRAGILFLAAATAALLVTGFVVWRRSPLNPVLLGTNVWLFAGALAFGLPIPPLAALLATHHTSLLFGAVLVTGAVLTTARPRTGFVGAEGPLPMVRRLSLALLVLTGVAVVWSHAFAANIRVGGGLPFILLNVCRRVLIRRFLETR